MLTVALTVASLLATQIAPVAITDSVARHPSAAVVADILTAADHLDSARRALATRPKMMWACPILSSI